MNKKKKSVQEKHEEEVRETTDMITAEDLTEQAVYAANAPDCCSDEEKAENMLNMLGANVVEPEIYHTEEEHDEVMGEEGTEVEATEIKEEEAETLEETEEAEEEAEKEENEELEEEEEKQELVMGGM